MSLGPSEVLAGLALVLLLAYHYLTRNFDFWKKRGVRGPRPLPLFGNFKDVALRRLHLADQLKVIYEAYPDEPVVGLFMRGKPIVLARDSEILKDVMIKSFPVFADRGVRIHADVDPLSQHLVFLEPKRWKPLRKRLSPTFSSGKIKEMFYLIAECAEHFHEYLAKLADEGAPIECREVTAKFTTDVIGMCAFGLNMNAMSDEDSRFRQMGRSVFEHSFQNWLRRTIRTLPPWLARFAKLFINTDERVAFFSNTVKQTMEYRRKSGVRRNDFIDLLIDIKNDPKEIDEEEMTDMLLTAQAFVFFAAGFETSSTTMSHALYELARNPGIQELLRKEVRMSIAANNGKLSYDGIKDMKYMDKVVKETLRKYPPAFILNRKALEDHTFPDTKISIPKGTNILIPTYAIHHDSNIYPEPEKFDPERFSEEVASTRHSMNYLPFGEGPRNCIGERFAYYQTKVGLATTIKNFKFEVCDKTFTTYVKDIDAGLLAPKNGIYLRIKNII